MPDPQQQQPPQQETWTDANGQTYVVTHPAPTDLASEGGFLRKTGNAIYGALPEIAGMGAAAGTEYLTGGAASPWIAPITGGTTALVQRILEGERDPSHIAGSTALHTIAAGLPELGRLPGVSDFMSSAARVGGRTLKIAKKIPGLQTMIDALWDEAPEGADMIAEGGKGFEAIDPGEQVAAAGGIGKATPEMQIKVLEKQLADPKFANDVATRRYLMQTITKIRDAAAQKAATTAAAAKAGGVVEGGRIAVPLAEIMKDFFYPNESDVPPDIRGF